LRVAAFEKGKRRNGNEGEGRLEGASKKRSRRISSGEVEIEGMKLGSWGKSKGKLGNEKRYRGSKSKRRGLGSNISGVNGKEQREKREWRLLEEGLRGRSLHKGVLKCANGTNQDSTTTTEGG